MHETSPAPILAPPAERPDSGFWRQLTDFARLIRHNHLGRRLLAYVMALVGVIGVTAAMQVLLNAWNQPFYDALTRKDLPEFLVQLWVFGLLAGVLLVLNITQLWLDQRLKLDLRRGLFAAMLARWSAPGKALELARAGEIGKNPDQRLQADIDGLTDLTVALGIGLFQASLLLASFIGVLWHHSGGLALPLNGQAVVIPGFMVWCALGYAGLASWLSWRVGRRLVPMSAERAAREAAFRFEIVRVSEAAENVRLARGEAAEAARIEASFARLVSIIGDVIRATVGLTWVTAGSGWLAIVAPIVVATPFYFSTDMTIGELMLVVGAFNQVQGALRWFINNFSGIANWRATLFRVVSFERALARLGSANCRPDNGQVARCQSTGGIEISSLRIVTPHVTVRLAQDDIRLPPGGRLLLHGRSGSGKTVLFRTLAGLTDQGAGRLAMPPPERVEYLPTRPYLPPGTLREVLAYPQPGAAFSSHDLRTALAAVGLEELQDELDREAPWAQVLGESDKQSLAFARVVLKRPDWLVMDDALTRLDPEALAQVLSLLRGPLAGVGLVDIGNGTTPPGLFTQVVEIVSTPGSENGQAGNSQAGNSQAGA